MFYKYLLFADSYSGAHASSSSQVISSAISSYHTYLKTVYENSPISPETKWPPTPSRKYINLAVVEGEKCREDYIGHTLQGNVSQILNNRKEISIQQILEPEENQNRLRLVFVEGTPGIGKSTLAWELCRKWDEFLCMKKYSLVILFRLREEEVQQMTKVSDLFISYETEEKKSLVEELLKSNGDGVLFILDGFDELPKVLQRKGFVLNLIRGIILPASTVLVTSRPSATAELLTSCGPLVQKRIEILGFTQESVEEYARSVFSSEPEKLTNFKAYISASKNPAINSLMYIPLNAAIIVQIYRNSTSDNFLPHTLTELYTQLCLTYLNRYLQSDCFSFMIDKFEDLPHNLYEQFCRVSEIAFEGIKKQEVIFHTAPPNLIHFGFLDAVSALYGGSRISYNFLHLTLQEFFAAYHISKMCEAGLDVLNQYGKDEQWNVVWRFVAGLTKFQHYKGVLDVDEHFLFKKHCGADTVLVSLFFIQCAFEAQDSKHLIPSELAMQFNNCESAILTALDLYSLGYCIANYPSLYWEVNIEGGNHGELGLDIASFVIGLNTKSPSLSKLNLLRLRNCCNVSIANIELHSLTFLQLSGCDLNNDDMLQLSEFIPHMPLLKFLDIAENEDAVGQQDGVFQKLCLSNVTALDVSYTCDFQDSPLDSCSALQNLINPLSGSIKVLKIVGNCELLLNLVSAPSSLNVLSIWYTEEISLSGFAANTCLSKLSISIDPLVDCEGIVRATSQDIVQILKHNKALQLLEFRSIDPQRDASSLRNIVSALSENTTLHNITLYVASHSLSRHEFNEGGNLTMNFRPEDYPELNCHPRVTLTCGSLNTKTFWDSAVSYL